MERVPCWPVAGLKRPPLARRPRSSSVKRPLEDGHVAPTVMGVGSLPAVQAFPIAADPVGGSFSLCFCAIKRLDCIDVFEYLWRLFLPGTRLCSIAKAGLPRWS